MKGLLKVSGWFIAVPIFLCMIGMQLQIPKSMVGFNHIKEINSAQDMPDIQAIQAQMFAAVPRIIMIAVIVFTITSIWLWTAAVYLHRQLPSGVSMPLIRFQILAIVPFVCIPVVAYFFQQFSFDSFGFEQAFQYVPLIMLLNFIAIACWIHNVVFVAKSLRAVELNRKPKNDEFVGEFFLLWVFPIGVVLLQPRIKKLLFDPQPVTEVSPVSE